MTKFKYAFDNKRYHTWNYYLRNTFGEKVFKVSINAGFTCPNIDGKVAYGGCTYCSKEGSGDFAGNPKDDLIKQFDENIAENVKEIMQKDESDAAIAKIVRLLSGTGEICYKDVRYKSLEEFVNSLNAEVIDYEFISYIKRGLHRNCDNSDDDAKICKGIDECIDKSCGDDKLLYYLIQKGFSKNKSLHIGSYEVKELSDFIEYIIKNGLNEEIEKMDFMNIIAWLYINGHEIDVKKVQEVRSIYELRNLL